jgi:hypothetical protein
VGDAPALVSTVDGMALVKRFVGTGSSPRSEVVHCPFIGRGGCLALPLSLEADRLFQRVMVLPPHEVAEFYQNLAHRVHPEDSMPSVDNFRDSGFEGGLFCPHCQSTRVHRHGRYHYTRRSQYGPDGW